jgi:predicted RNA-binding protein (virulence factor B family)
MIYIGRTNRLRVTKLMNFGAYLDGGEYGEILLPRRYVPEGCKPGDRLQVFVYADSEDRLVATTERPKVQVGEAAYLKVRQQNEVGTFMDWGLGKDLLVPFNEQAWPMHPGRASVVYCYLDSQTNRIAGSTRFSRHLEEDGRGDFEPGQEVKLMIATRTPLGYKAIINNTHLGLIFKSDVFGDLKYGQQLKGYIKSIRGEDGKIDLSLQPSAEEVRDQLEDKILAYLRAHGGVSHITDKSPPTLIYKTFNASKANFKRALGRLYKKRRVRIDNSRVTLLKE